jgi:hypothetical protein
VAIDEIVVGLDQQRIAWLEAQIAHLAFEAGTLARD